MHYQTIVLELLKERPQMHDQLKRNRLLLPTMKRYAVELKTRHEAWKEQLSQAQPGSDPSQIASEAMEYAVQELVDCLPPVSPPDDDDPISLEAAMAFLHRHTPPA